MAPTGGDRTRAPRYRLPLASWHPPDRPIRRTLFGGLIGVPDRQAQVRALVGLGFWLGAPLFLVRLLGRVRLRGPMHTASRWWARGVARHFGMRLDIQGLEHIAPDEAYIVTPLHEGFADAVTLLHLPLNQRFVVRDELFTWRLFGGLMRDTGQIEVCPESGLRSYRELRRLAPAVLDSGESIAMAPQGSILGIEIDFRTGPFALAKALGRPILPVALTGAHRVWEHPYSARVRHGQHVSMTVLPPMYPDELRALGVEGARLEIQRRLKAQAFAEGMAPVRRYVPARDGYWDGYAFEIDPDFPDLYADIDEHRSQLP